jgi:hypothetical protein
MDQIWKNKGGKKFTQEEIQKISEQEFFSVKKCFIPQGKTVSYLKKKRVVLTDSIRLLGPAESDKINDQVKREFPNPKFWNINSTQKEMLDKQFKMRR